MSGEELEWKEKFMLMFCTHFSENLCDGSEILFKSHILECPHTDKSIPNYII